MSDSQDCKCYLDSTELAARTGCSESTIWRLKRVGKIPFYQPGGKGSLVKFPPNAIELAGLSLEQSEPGKEEESPTSERLPGPQPKWMSSNPENKN